MDLTNTPRTLIVSDKERNLLNLLRQIPYGEVVIVMHDGQPDRIERGIEKKKL